MKYPDEKARANAIAQHNQKLVVLEHEVAEAAIQNYIGAGYERLDKAVAKLIKFKAEVKV